MATFISKSPDETRALGEQWGRDAQPGWVIALIGDLGTGKTELVKGIARGLRVSDRVHSPTFTLVNVYNGGRLPLFHLDFYRLETPQQILRAGLEEYFYRTDGVTVVEWAERWLKSVSSLEFRVSSSKLRKAEIATLGESERRIEYEDFGD